MTIISNNNEILIVGGGPVGMLLTLELALFGIKPRIISKYKRLSPHSKATIVWPGVLEFLERTGIAEKLMAEAHYFDRMNYYSNKKLVGNIRFDNLKYTPYPFGITIPQWKTEKILEDALKDKGIFIEYGYEFISGNNTQDNVEVVIKGPNGNITTEKYKWIIGADGFSSQVRSAFDFNFDGFSMETKLAITDAEIVNEATSSEVGYYLHKTGNMVLAPLGDGIFRVGASIPSDYNGEIDRNFFNSVLKTRVPGGKKLGEMKFCGQFNAHVRSVDTLRKGRVLLAGDSAHAMSPSGAQGLNCGFHDVVNLGWKLAAVINNNSHESILDSYSNERLFGIKQITKVSTFLANISLYKNYAKIFLRDSIFRIASKTGVIDKYFSPRLAQLNIPVSGAPNNKYSLEVGKRVPLQWIKTSSALTMSLCQFTILLWPGNSYSYFQWKLFQEEVYKIFPMCNCVDLAGKTVGRLRNLLPEEAICIVVRPDGYIFELYKININSYDQLISELKKLFSI